uniref:Uncharacterized protein n=1 Tax=Neospora caninum (strain Liverpool) TaxID=572307 RepID=A0A0F7UL86_NEOCL|nr:TPA: hypothetical protein BN1204_046435 [Neospora caninum Liverpool]
MHFRSLQPWLYGVRRYSEISVDSAPFLSFAGSQSDIGVRTTHLPCFNVPFHGQKKHPTVDKKGFGRTRLYAR